MTKSTNSTKGHAYATHVDGTCANYYSTDHAFFSLTTDDTFFQFDTHSIAQCHSHFFVRLLDPWPHCFPGRFSLWGAGAARSLTPLKFHTVSKGQHSIYCCLWETSDACFLALFLSLPSKCLCLDLHLNPHVVKVTMILATHSCWDQCKTKRSFETRWSVTKEASRKVQRHK